MTPIIRIYYLSDENGVLKRHFLHVITYNIYGNELSYSETTSLHGIIHLDKVEKCVIKLTYFKEQES